MKKTNNEVVKQIANLIKDCDTDYRGNLFKLIGAHLINDAQGYTGNLFIKMGYLYGINDDMEFKDE